MDLKIVAVTPDVDSLVCDIIKRVGEEFGAVGEGYGPSDAEVENMSQHYSDINSLYLVATLNDKVVGGCGVAPFNESRHVCELKKLFLLKESRGHGLGKSLTTQCLEYAKQQGYQQCYLDTLSNMDSAIGLYEKLGFEHLSEPLSGSIHNSCDVWMLKTL